MNQLINKGSRPLWVSRQRLIITIEVFYQCGSCSDLVGINMREQPRSDIMCQPRVAVVIAAHTLQGFYDRAELPLDKIKIQHAKLEN